MEATAPVVSIVIPVYNEGANIAQTLRALQQNVPVAHEILICYDFDEDSTLPAVRPLMNEMPELRLVKNSIARGPSGALRSGFAEARGDRVLVVMADLCDDLTQIPQLLQMVPAEADIVCPSRYCKGGEQQLTGIKVLIPRLAGFSLRLLTGIPTYDPTNSFKIYSREVLDDLRLRSTFSFSVTLEIVAKAHCLGYRIAEIPTVWRDRQHGKTNFKLWRSIPVYLRWFGVAMLRGRFFWVPRGWLRRWYSAKSGRAPDETLHSIGTAR